MKIQTLWLSLAALSGTAVAQVNIPILNPKFNVDVLTCSPGNCYQPAITGWIVGPNSGVQNMSTVQYPSAPVSGLYCAYVGGSPSSGSIMQTLGATVQPNTTYVLSVLVGARADNPFTGYSASLLAGNVALKSGHAATPSAGTFVTEQVVYQSGPNPAQLGQPLQVLIKSAGNGQVDIAGVSLIAVAE